MISNLRNKRERKYQRVHLFPRNNFEVHVRPYSSQIAENTDVHWTSTRFKEVSRYRIFPGTEKVRIKGNPGHDT